MAIYHLVLANENYEQSAATIFKLVSEAQMLRPNYPRCIYLDIEGHQNADRGFDDDMFGCSKDLLGFMMQYVNEICRAACPRQEPALADNDLPERLDFCGKVDSTTINEAIDRGVERIWLADKGGWLRLPSPDERFGYG